MGLPKNGWFILENHMKNRSFGGTPISGNVHICVMLLNTHNTIINTLQPLNTDNYLL